MPPKRQQVRPGRAVQIFSDDSDDSSDYVIDYRNSKRAKILPSSATDSATAPATMSIKAEIVPTNPAPSPPDKPTLKAFGAGQKIDSTPLDAPAPYFKLGERVTVRFTKRTGPVKQGAIIKAVAWKADIKSYIYKLASVELQTMFEPVFLEAAIETSQYGIGDVVKITAFDTVTRRTIEKIHVSDSGEFTYEIGAGFRARAKDITGIVARCH